MYILTTDILLLTNDRPVLSSERASHKVKTVTVKRNIISDHEPQMGLDIKTLTD
jgi:hypothetical protein